MIFKFFPTFRPLFPFYYYLTRLSSSKTPSLYSEWLIKDKTIISNDHLTPELSLHLITSECELWFAKSNESVFKNDPFWAIYWPGGQALARYILDNKALFSGKNVLDIGSGSGACAIAAAKCNANIVLANDIDEMSLVAIKLNAELNNVKLFLKSENIIGGDVDSITITDNSTVLRPNWDFILIGDMFYDFDFSKILFEWLNKLVKNNKIVLIGDPGRYAMREVINDGNLVKLAEYSITKDEHFGFESCIVYQLKSYDS